MRALSSADMHQNPGNDSSRASASRSSWTCDIAHNHSAGKQACSEAGLGGSCGVTNIVYSFATVLVPEQMYLRSPTLEQESQSSLDVAVHDWRYCEPEAYCV